MQNRTRGKYVYKGVEYNSVASINVDPFGNKHKSFSAMCRFYNQTRNSVYSRMVRGMTLDEALLKPMIEKQKNIKINVNGKTFNSLHEACKHYDITDFYVYYHARKLNVTYKDFFEMLELERIKKVEKDAVQAE